jgi:hypothetical protein
MPEPKRLRIIPILITLAATLGLSVGSFYGCARTFSVGGETRLNAFFFWSFMICAVGCVISLIWLLVTLARNFLRRRAAKGAIL